MKDYTSKRKDYAKEEKRKASERRLLTGYDKYCADLRKRSARQAVRRELRSLRYINDRDGVDVYCDKDRHLRNYLLWLV